MAPPSDPVAEVWRSPELLGCVASFLAPSLAVWTFTRVNKAAAAAPYGSSGQPVPRTIGLGWALSSGLLATPQGQIHARAWCQRLTYKQRVKLLCRAAAADCSQESLEAAVVAAGLSPPPLKVLVAAASAGRLGVCRWLVEVLGCTGLLRLACLCLVSAAGPGPEVVEVARAWLTPAALEGWSEEQEAQAASGDVEAVVELLRDWQPGGVPYDNIRLWRRALEGVQARRDLQQLTDDELLTLGRLACFQSEFYSGPHAAMAVSRLAQLESAAPPAFARLLRPTLYTAAKAGHAEAVRFLLSREARPQGEWRDAPALAAAGKGHVGVLRALHEAGCMGDPAACFAAALKGGSLPLVEWLVETFGVPALRVDNATVPSAARSGSVQLLRALRGLLGSAAPKWGRCRGGCWANAAASGCEEAVEWLAKEAGVPKVSIGTRHELPDAYREAASQGDLRMVQRLRKLGCPHSARDAEALAKAARRVPAADAALPWLAEPGCPASWGAAAAEAEAQVQGRAQEAEVETILQRMIHAALLLAETQVLWPQLTGGAVDPCRHGLLTWGCVGSRLLAAGLTLAGMVVWLHVKALPVRKTTIYYSIAYTLAHLAVIILGLSDYIRFAVWVVLGFVVVDGRQCRMF
ncbi:hypothetical protein HYH03_012600 [Edaphochlamys debaryana]|uniref:Uncharacterized protein n=1 Tax=Edaphochlamys debaryana TaxID=47281 RepID=A0A836BTX2_9CHLO|nr:hypothetical protein HYH03_012600 [Edaphochlamys debaryana]|eukprot:KAG2488800.1 hypothetical protein HYH03_012600 [Edaphochlamys debaryana]